MAKRRNPNAKPAPSLIVPPRATIGRLYALPQLMPTAAQLYDAYIDAMDRDRLADADLCVTALYLAVNARFARAAARGQGLKP